MSATLQTGICFLMKSDSIWRFMKSLFFLFSCTDSGWALFSIMRVWTATNSPERTKYMASSGFKGAWSSGSSSWFRVAGAGDVDPAAVLLGAAASYSPLLAWYTWDLKVSVVISWPLEHFMWLKLLTIRRRAALVKVLKYGMFRTNWMSCSCRCFSILDKQRW